MKPIMKLDTVIMINHIFSVETTLESPMACIRMGTMNVMR